MRARCCQTRLQIHIKHPPAALKYTHLLLHTHVRHLPYLVLYDLKRVQPRVHAEKISRRKARNHGRRTSTRPGHRRPFIGCPSGILRLRARAQRRRLLGDGEKSLFFSLEKNQNKRSWFFKSWLPSSPPPPPPPPAGVVHFSVVSGRETRSYLIYSGWSASHPPPRFRRLTRSVPGVAALLRAGPKQNRPHPAHNIISTT